MDSNTIFLILVCVLFVGMVPASVVLKMINNKRFGDPRGRGREVGVSGWSESSEERDDNFHDEGLYIFVWPVGLAWLLCKALGMLIARVIVATIGNRLVKANDWLNTKIKG